MRRRTLIALGVAGFTTGCGGNGAENQDNRQTGTATETPTSSPADSATSTNAQGDSSTDSPTESPTLSPTEVPSRQFSGSGESVREDVSIRGGLVIAEAMHSGGSNFIVELVPTGDDTASLLVNVIGDFSGRSAVMATEGEYILDIDAGGEWGVTLMEPRPETGETPPISVSGSGYQVLGPFSFSGTGVATGSHNGEGNFIVEVLPPEQGFPTLVFNEVGSFDGETTFNYSGVGFVAIEADGDWTLEIE